MRKSLELNISNIEEFKNKLLHCSDNYAHFAFFDSNNFEKKNTEYTYYEYDFLAACGSVEDIKGNNKNDFNKFNVFNKLNNDWLFGFLSYDLKNELENLKSNNTDNLRFPNLHFFIPELVFVGKDNKVFVHYLENLYLDSDIQKFVNDINKHNTLNHTNQKINISINSRFSREEYIQTVVDLKKHIQRGDIYEANLCQEFYSNTKIHPVSTYLKLRNISPTPFSCFYKLDDKYLISASPERYIKKKNTKIISQPIKGTIKRSLDKDEDKHLKNILKNDPKERAENVMIVDLVRNDLSKTAIKGSVKVEELYGIYSFTQVHQMISTVISEVEPSANIVDILKTTFPMGSMTGAPKIRAMELIEEYEKTKRGLYSGAVGYISPKKDFDFNVVIRSILYNQSKKYVSYTVGGAITSLAIPENEYEECLIKAKAMNEVLK